MRFRHLLCGFALFLLVGAQASELRAQFGGFGSLFGRNPSANNSDHHHHHRHHGNDAASRRGSSPRHTQNGRPAGQQFNTAHDAGHLPDMDQLKVRIQRVLDDYYGRPLNTRDNDSWEVMHSIVAYGVKSEVAVGGPQGDRRNAIGWLCYNLPLRGPRMLTIRNNLPNAVRGVSVQGHHGQFLAILAQSRLLRSYPLLIDGKKFTVDDLIEAEKRTCNAGDELTFKLIALAHYLPTDAQWRCERGQKWDIPRLIREEIRQPITHSAACGGTHRLMGLAYAVRRRQQQGKPIDGDFALAQQYLQQYFDWTFSLQNSDGSFSTAWLARRENRPDIDRKIQCTGHITEWLVYSLPKHELHNPQVVAAVDFLTTSLERGRKRDWKIGPLGHALHALAIYKERMYEGKEDRLPDDAASSTESTADADSAKSKTGSAAKPSGDMNDAAESSAKAGADPAGNAGPASEADAAADMPPRSKAGGLDVPRDDEPAERSIELRPEEAAADTTAMPLMVPSLGSPRKPSTNDTPVEQETGERGTGPLDMERASDDVIPAYEPVTGSRTVPHRGGVAGQTPKPGSAAGRLRIRMEAGPDEAENPLATPPSEQQPEGTDALPSSDTPPALDAVPEDPQSFDAALFQLLQPGSSSGAVTDDVAGDAKPSTAGSLDAVHAERAGQAAGGAATLLIREPSDSKFGRQLPARRELPRVHMGRRMEAAEGPALIGPR